jgi:hypothetical protein
LTHCLIVQFTELSGGLEGGADPPAFQRAEKQRLEAEKKSDEAAAIKEAESISDTQSSDVENTFLPPVKVIILEIVMPRTRSQKAESLPVTPSA